MFKNPFIDVTPPMTPADTNEICTKKQTLKARGQSLHAPCHATQMHAGAVKRTQSATARDVTALIQKYSAQ